MAARIVTHYFFIFMMLSVSFNVLADTKIQPLCTSLLSQQQLCVLTEPTREPEWFIQTAKQRNALPSPAVSMLWVSKISIDAENHYLAVVSVGEGHPILDVFSLIDVLAGKAVEPLLSVNPYPGALSLLAWRSGELWVESDVHLLDYSENNEQMEILETAQQYALQPKDWTWRLLTE